MVCYWRTQSEFTDVDFYYTLKNMTLNLTEMQNDYVIGIAVTITLTTRATLFQFFLTKMEFREKNNRNQIEKQQETKRVVIPEVLEKVTFLNILYLINFKAEYLI